MRKAGLQSVLLIVLVATVVIAVLRNGTLPVYAAQIPVYTYEIDGLVFESTDSAEDAWQRAMTHQYEQGYMTVDEIQLAYEDFTQEHFSSTINESIINSGDLIAPMSSGALIEGDLIWQTAKGGGTLPLREVEVHLYRWNWLDKLIGDSPILLATTYTDNNGAFKFLLSTGEDDLYVRVIAGSRTFRIATNWLIDYSIRTDWFDISTGYKATVSFNTIAYDDGNTSRAFFMSQGMGVGQRFVTEMGANISGQLNVDYPSTTMDLFDGTAYAWGIFPGFLKILGIGGIH